MGTLQIDVDAAIEKELAKKDAAVTRLQGKVAKLEARNAELEETLRGLKRAKDALLDAADLLDPYRYDDDD